jgi:ABC-type bacteriocin/lantibiotic exporter with double-glycine peptidase domain
MNFDPTPLLAQQSPIPGLTQFLSFLQTVTVLVGICLVLYGAWQVHQGRVSEGALSLVAGFLSCLAVPIIRLIAGWTGAAL